MLGCIFFILIYPFISAILGETLQTWRSFDRCVSLEKLLLLYIIGTEKVFTCFFLYIN